MVQIERLEVWHNKENLEQLEELDKDFCGGVPFFINTKTGKWICGEASYKELKDWAAVLYQLGLGATAIKVLRD